MKIINDFLIIFCLIGVFYLNVRLIFPIAGVFFAIMIYRIVIYQIKKHSYLNSIFNKLYWIIGERSQKLISLAIFIFLLIIL